MEKIHNRPRFPIFIDLDGKRALVVGAGKVAARRVGVLLGFGAVITVVAPKASDAMLENIGRVTWKQEKYSEIGGEYTLILAATDDREINRKIGEDARFKGIPVSVADSAEESTFWFPAIIRAGGVVAGIVSENGDHAAVKKTAQKLRKKLEEQA